MSDQLTWLMEWYADQCDGEWEHYWGVEIGTVDNPGWSLKVDLHETDLEGRTFARVEHNLSSDVSWWVCWVEDSTFHGACGPRDLPTVIAIFRNWAAADPSPLAGEGVGGADG